MIKISKGDSFVKTTAFLKNALNFKRTRAMRKLKRLGELGVKALEDYTPKKTGKTASSWQYTIEETSESLSVIFSNTNVVDDVNIAIIIQYGHGTKNGGYVKGIDYINPALRPLFDNMAEDMRKEMQYL